MLLRFITGTSVMDLFGFVCPSYRDAVFWIRIRMDLQLHPIGRLDTDLDPEP
jgi:hypothetical protein